MDRDPVLRRGGAPFSDRRTTSKDDFEGRQRAIPNRSELDWDQVERSIATWEEYGGRSRPGQGAGMGSQVGSPCPRGPTAAKLTIGSAIEAERPAFLSIVREVLFGDQRNGQEELHIVNGTWDGGTSHDLQLCRLRRR